MVNRQNLQHPVTGAKADTPLAGRPRVSMGTFAAFEIAQMGGNLARLSQSTGAGQWCTKNLKHASHNITTFQMDDTVNATGNCTAQITPTAKLPP